jgi:hypothetical protein
MAAARTKTFLGSRYHRLARRRGKQRALVAVGNSILTIALHLLSDPTPTSPTLALTGTTGSHQCAANASSSPNSNGSGKKSFSKKKRPPPDQPHHLTRLRGAPPGAPARPLQHDFRFRRLYARAGADGLVPQQATFARLLSRGDSVPR